MKKIEQPEQNQKQPKKSADRIIAAKRKIDVLTREAARLGFNIENLAERVAYRVESGYDFADTGYVKFEEYKLRPVNVTVTVNLKKQEESDLGFNAECTIGWGRCIRSISASTACVALYQRAIELASLIEVTLS